MPEGPQLSSPPPTSSERERRLTDCLPQSQCGPASQSCETSTFDGRQREVKRGALARFTFHPNPTAHSFDVLRYQREPHPNAGRAATVHSLKETKDMLVIPRLDTDSPVAHTEDPLLLPPPGRHLNTRRFSRLRIVDGIADQACQYPLQASPLRPHDWQSGGGHRRAARAKRLCVAP